MMGASPNPHLADYPNSQLELLAKCGHSLMQDIPIAFAPEVQAILETDN